MSDSLEPAVEVCAGCGVEAPTHPWVGVTHQPGGVFLALPVCGPCHADPSHRTFSLKMHYFPREQRDLALRRAGSSDIG